MTRRAEVVEGIYKVVLEAISDAIENEQDFPIPKGTSLDACVQLKNNEFNEPDHPWYSIEVNLEASDQIGFGGQEGNLYEMQGELVVEINTPIGSNMMGAYQMADVIIQKVRGQLISGATFYEAFDTHNDRDESWEITLLTAAFEYDEISG